MCALWLCVCTAISTKQHSTNGFPTCWLREELEEATKRYMISIKSEQRSLPGLLEILFTVSSNKSKCRVCKSKDTSSCSQTVRTALVLASVIVRSQEIRRSRRRSNSKRQQGQTEGEGMGMERGRKLAWESDEWGNGSSWERCSMLQPLHNSSSNSNNFFFLARLALSSCAQVNGNAAHKLHTNYQRRRGKCATVFMYLSIWASFDASQSPNNLKWNVSLLFTFHSKKILFN